MDIHAVPGAAVLETESAARTPKLIFHPRISVTVDRRPRRISSDASAATQWIAHAMAYLADSRRLPDGRISQLDPTHPDVYALLLLMEAKYQIYVSCPVIERRTSTLAGLFKGRDRRRTQQNQADEGARQ